MFGKIIVDKFIARDSVVLVWSIQVSLIKHRKWGSHCQVPFYNEWIKCVVIFPGARLFEEQLSNF